MPTMTPSITLVLPFDQMPEMRTVLDRAMNTWEPNQQPKWLAEFSERVDYVIGLTAPDPVDAS